MAFKEGSVFSEAFHQLECTINTIDSLKNLTIDEIINMGNNPKIVELFGKIKNREQICSVLKSSFDQLKTEHV